MAVTPEMSASFDAVRVAGVGGMVIWSCSVKYTVSFRIHIESKHLHVVHIGEREGGR